MLEVMLMICLMIVFVMVTLEAYSRVTADDWEEYVRPISEMYGQKSSLSKEPIDMWDGFDCECSSCRRK